MRGCTALAGWQVWTSPAKVEGFSLLLPGRRSAVSKAAGLTFSIPKRISAKVTKLTKILSSGWDATKEATFGSGRELRSSDNTSISSSQPVTD